MALCHGMRPANASALFPRCPLNNDQLDFAFVAELPTALNPKPKRSPRTKVMAPTVAPIAPAVGDLETLAKNLDAHPDYRVIRRLVPRLQWPAAASAQICTVLILDTETTGLDATKEKVIELALLRMQIDLQSGLPVGSVEVYDGLEDPGVAIPKEIEKITGITQAMVAGQRLDEARITDLMQGVDLVIAHNAGFDRPFVESRLPQFSQFAWACSFADINWKDQGRSSAKLENLAQSLGLFYDAHRAEMDCHALLAVLTASLVPVSGASAGDNSEFGKTGLQCLIEKARMPNFRVRATNAPFDAKDKLKARGYRWDGDQKVWHTRVDSQPDLQGELAWLKENAYHQRSAVVQIEKMDAKVRYSTRPGETLFHQL